MGAETASLLPARPDLSDDVTFRAVVEECATGLMLQVDERVIYANPAALNCLGAESIRQLDGKPLSGLFDLESYSTLLPSLRKITPNDDQLFMGELKMRRRSGELIDVEVYHIGVPGDPAGTSILNFRDVTLVKRMESELINSQKLESVGRLAAGIAHEINTPIQFIGDSAYFVGTALTSLLDLLTRSRAELRRYAESAGDAAALERFASEERDLDLEYHQVQAPRAVERITDGVSRVSRIVSAMKCFSHPGADQASPVDINKLLSDTLIVAGHELRAAGEVTTAFGEVPPLHGFSGDLNQAFLNLVVNAAHAIVDRGAGATTPGRLTVTTGVENRKAVIRITDNGCGMSDHVQARLFEPFFTTKEVGRGTGQGLTVVRASIVGKHRGTIDVETAVGVGTTFTIRLPLDDPPPTEP
jgi:signal transduction histidine kinase